MIARPSLYSAAVFALVFAGTSFAADLPTAEERAQEIPVPKIKTAFPAQPGPDALPVRPELPDPLLLADGTRIKTAAQWSDRRAQIRQLLEHYAVGHLPPAPGNVSGKLVSTQTVLEGAAVYRLIRLSFGPEEKLSLNLGVFTPASATEAARVPAVIFPGGTPPGAEALPILPRPPGQGKGVNALLPGGLVAGDPNSPGALLAATGGNPSAPPPSRNTDPEAVAARIRDVLARGYGYVMFNNNDCAEDTTLRLADGSWAFRSTRFYPAYPGYDWGILGGWAWGVSRIVDYLQADPLVDKTKLIVSGVSRTGKSALIAAAFDDRIALAAPVVTGGGGIGAFRFSGEGRGGKEGLDLMMKKYPNWFSPHLHAFRGQTDKLPFDQHWFVALVAPRPFIALEGKTDGVSLINAVRQSIDGARPVYALLGVPEKLGVNYADHGHAFTAEDWTAMLDFADRHLLGKAVTRTFDTFPPDLSTPPAEIPTPHSTQSRP